MMAVVVQYDSGNGTARGGLMSRSHGLRQQQADELQSLSQCGTLHDDD
jgi:hypothetical protein